ncbi:MAG TPA: hypothetical protein VFQ61_22975 [Polyangiaceae bacterium]|nr:hypothetical protein [Polyangiaceae bacterium]
MATATSNTANPSSKSTSGVGSPISNEAYNVITALQAKLEGLEAYRKYSSNAGSSVWQELTRADVQSVELLVNELEQLVRDGKLRLREPGRADAE